MQRFIDKTINNAHNSQNDGYEEYQIDRSIKVGNSQLSKKLLKSAAAKFDHKAEGNKIAELIESSQTIKQSELEI